MKKTIVYFSLALIVFMANLVTLCAQTYLDGNSQNFGFTSSQLVFTTQVVVRSGAKVIATDTHVYYIGTNNKICEYFWNGNNWIGGGQLDWTTNYVQANTQICSNGNELFFVRSTDNRICRLAWNGTWQVSVLSATMIAARAGTDLVYSDNVIYYVGSSTDPAKNDKICYISRPNATSAFNSNNVLSTTSSFSALTGTQIIYVAPYATSPAAHVYYIGTGSRVYDIVRATTGSPWVNSTNYLAANYALPAIRSGSQLTNDNNQIFYVGADHKLYELHWVDNVTGWVGNLIMPSGVQYVKAPSQITYFDNHIYYIGSSDSKLCDLFRGNPWIGGTLGSSAILNNSSFSVFNGTTGHTVFWIGTDNRLKITLWDDVTCVFDGNPAYCTTAICQGQTWHNGVLNLTANNVTATSNIALPVDPSNPTAMPKSFYYVNTNGYGNVFLRNVVNGAIKSGWDLTRNDEFTSLSNTQSLWDPQGPWSHGRCINGTVDDQLWGERQYGTTWDPDNFSVSNGIGTITTKQENFTGLTWGWATNPTHDNNYYGPWAYQYTNALLCTGGINVDLNCTTANQYCVCGGTLPNNCVYGKKANTCGTYVPKYTPGTWGPTKVNPKFYQKYGWFEIRCKVPRGRKMWSAFWAVNKGFYPSEIDFFEIEGNGKTMLSNIYYEDCNADVDHAGALLNRTYATGYRYYDDFYTYACEWGPSYIKWYLNNELIATQTDVNKMQHDSMWVMVNNYVVEARAQCDPLNFPNNYDIDYVRIYQNPAWYGLRTASGNADAEEQQQDISFNVFPNPANNIVNFEYQFADAGTTDIKLIDISGRIVVHDFFIATTGINKGSIKIAGLKRGIYFLRVADKSRKLIIE